jgi:hypothetical protein
MTVIIGRKNLRTCRGCGCDDDHACETETGPCSWTLLDLEGESGVCSACAEKVHYHPLALGAMGLASEQEQTAAILAFAEIAPPYREQAIHILQEAGA